MKTTVSIASVPAPTFTASYAHSYRADCPELLHTISEARPMNEYSEKTYLSTVENSEGFPRDVYAHAPTKRDADNGSNVSICHPVFKEHIQQGNTRGGAHPFRRWIQPAKLAGKKLFVYESREDDVIVWVPYIHKSL